MSSVMKLNTQPPPQSSVVVVASIDDLLVEILVRLPLRQVARFKSVSKHWKSLISDPKFHSALARKPNTPPAFIFQSRILHSLPTQTVSSKIHIASIQNSTITQSNHLTCLWPRGVASLNSCNGLLLGGPDHVPHVLDLEIYHVCNPTTKKHFRLPELGGGVQGMCLAFDPSVSIHYKVVCVRRLETPIVPSSEFEIEVFSSEAGCWRKQGKPFVASRVDFRRGVYWKGAVHWIGYSHGKSLYFDPTNEQETASPKEMPNPPVRIVDRSWSHSWTHHDAYEYFGESGGHLHFIDYGVSGDESECSVYEMRADYSEWFVKYKIRCSALGCRTRDDRAVIPPFSVWGLVRGKKDEDDFLVFEGNKKTSLVRYNLVQQTLEIISEFEGYGFQAYYFESPVQHIESLCEV